MNLSSLISRQTNTPLEQIMLLRHSNSKTQALRRHRASLDDYTCVQLKNSRYDYFCDGETTIRTVGVIVNDRLYAVIRIDGIEREDTTRNLVSP